MKNFNISPDVIPYEDGAENNDTIGKGYDDSLMVDNDGDTVAVGQSVLVNPYAYKHGLDMVWRHAGLDSRNAIMLYATKSTIEGFHRVGDTFSVVDIQLDGVYMGEKWGEYANGLVKFQNYGKPDEEKMKRFSTIPSRAVALLIMATGDFRNRMNVKNEKSGILMRQRSGHHIGTWKLQTGKDDLDILISTLNSNATEKFRKEVRYHLETELESVCETKNSKIAMLQDGIYDFETREFMSYEHPDYDFVYGDVVSQSKLYGVNWTDESSDVLEKKATIYNPNDNTTWSPIQGLKDLVGDDIALKAIRQIMHFAIRRTRGDFAWFFVNTTGNAAGGGGKSTVIQIIKNICGGEQNCITLSYERLGERFALYGLENKYAILSDETSATHQRPKDTNVYKTLATNGAVPVEGKFKDMHFMKFDGCMVQAVNGYPMFSDPSNSSYRRFLAIGFEKMLTQNGRKRDYIRDDYINRPEVIQCYVKWAMELGCLDTYSTDVIDYCMPFVEDIKNNTKTVFEFMPEMMRLEKYEGYFYGMNEIGRSFLYAIYCKWDEFENSTRIHLSQKKFWISVCEWVQANPSCGWEVTEKITHIYQNTPFQKELVDYDLGKAWCKYDATEDGVYRPNGYFVFPHKSIRSGLVRVNKLPKNTSQGTVLQGDDTTD